MSQFSSPSSLVNTTAQVIQKAILGKGLKPFELLDFLGVQDMKEVIQDSFLLERSAGFLGLNAEALKHLAIYQPELVQEHWLERLVLPFDDDDLVNAWLVRHQGVHVLFDAGCDRFSVLHALEKLGVDHLDAWYLTHGHRDHIGACESLYRLYGKAFGCIELGAWVQSMQAGEAHQIGHLTITAKDASGHYTPSLAYEVNGLPQSILVTGDALFAGSMGGCKSTSNYACALKNASRLLREAKQDAYLLHGHGPASRVREELCFNPFIINL